MFQAAREQCQGLLFDLVCTAVREPLKKLIDNNDEYEIAWRHKEGLSVL